MKRFRWLLAVPILMLAAWFFWPQARFTAGGAMVNVGYWMQDSLSRYDFAHTEVSPDEVWQEFMRQNQMASLVRSLFPRSTRHPLVALVTCMDSRLDTNEIAGDTRRYYYVLRLAGSVLADKEEEMLELAVANGVRVVVFTTHTQCAADRAAQDPAQRKRYPKLTEAVEQRQARFREFLDRPTIRNQREGGKLLVKWVDLDTQNERVMMR